MTQAPSHLQGVRFFLSVDIVNSVGEKEDNPTGWMEAFRNLQASFATIFKDRVSNCLAARMPNSVEPDLRVWRFKGDELLMYSSYIRDPRHIQVLVSEAHQTIRAFDKEHINGGIGVKGVAWAAGFPIRNVQMFVDPENPPYLFMEQNSLYFEQASGAPAQAWGRNYYVEFLGPEIDLGFRLSNYASPGRLLVSLDAAALAAQASPVAPLRFFHVDWGVLRGLYHEVPYPIIWVDCGELGEPPIARTSYEAYTSRAAEKYLSNQARIEDRAVCELNKQHIRDCKGSRIEMYLGYDDQAGVPKDHATTWETSLGNSPTPETE